MPSLAAALRWLAAQLRALVAPPACDRCRAPMDSEEQAHAGCCAACRAGGR